LGSAAKGFDMNTVDSKAVDVEILEDFKETRQRIDPGNVSFQQIEERASARTKILNAILAKQGTPSWRHWGLNE
jgi:hypothetical protein